jgi:hypothetical protein
MIGKFEVYEPEKGFFDSLDDESKEYIISSIHTFLDPDLHEVVIFERQTSRGDRVFIRYKRKDRIEYAMPIEIGFNKDLCNLVTRTKAESMYQHARSSNTSIAPPTDWVKTCNSIDFDTDTSMYKMFDPNKPYTGGYVEMKFRGTSDQVLIFRN